MKYIFKLMKIVLFELVVVLLKLVIVVGCLYWLVCYIIWNLHLPKKTSIKYAWGLVTQTRTTVHEIKNGW